MKANGILFFSVAFALGWSLYFGGVLFMYVVWRPLQQDISPSHTAVICSLMGKKFKWIAGGSLILCGIGYIGLLNSVGSLGGISNLARQDQVRFSTTWGLIGGAILVSLLSLNMIMGHILHPNSHSKLKLRVRKDNPDLLRKRKLAAIKRMDIALKVELILSFCATVLLAWATARGR